MTDEHHNPTVADVDEQGNEIPTPAAAAPEDKPKHVTITFKSNDGAEVSFKLKATTKLKKAMDAYAARANRERRSLRFLFDGERVLDDKSPDDVSLRPFCVFVWRGDMR